MSGVGKRVVVTGGSGGAGLFIIPELLAHGYTVVNADMMQQPRPGATFVKCDSTVLDQVLNVTAGAYAIVHMAAIASPTPPDQEVWRVNMTGMHKSTVSSADIASSQALNHVRSLFTHRRSLECPRGSGASWHQEGRHGKLCQCPRRGLGRQDRAGVLSNRRGPPDPCSGCILRLKALGRGARRLVRSPSQRPDRESALPLAYAPRGRRGYLQGKSGGYRRCKRTGEMQRLLVVDWA